MRPPLKLRNIGLDDCIACDMCGRRAFYIEPTELGYVLRCVSCSLANRKGIEMAIGKRKGGSGAITPLLKYDARSGVFYKCDRVQHGGVWSTEQTNVTTNFAATFDFDSLQVGWIAFTGGVPEFLMFPLGSDIGEAPSDKHKQGFRLLVKLAGGGGLREFSSTAAATWDAVDALHSAYEAEKGARPGKLPFVKLAEVRAEKGPMGTVFTPDFKIESWVVRPAELPLPTTEVEVALEELLK